MARCAQHVVIGRGPAHRRTRRASAVPCSTTKAYADTQSTPAAPRRPLKRTRGRRQARTPGFHRSGRRFTGVAVDPPLSRLTQWRSHRRQRAPRSKGSHPQGHRLCMLGDTRVNRPRGSWQRTPAVSSGLAQCWLRRRTAQNGPRTMSGLAWLGARAAMASATHARYAPSVRQQAASSSSARSASNQRSRLMPPSWAGV